MFAISQYFTRYFTRYARDISTRGIERESQSLKGKNFRLLSIIPLIAGNRPVFDLEGQRARVLLIYSRRGPRQSHEVFREGVGRGLEIVLLNVN